MSRPENDQTLVEFIDAHVPGLRAGDQGLHDLIDAVNRNGKGGTLALIIKVEPGAGQHGHALQVSSQVQVKAPKDPAPTALVWTLPSGKAVDYDPNQPTLPLDNEDGADPTAVFSVDAPNQDEAVSDIPRTPEEQQRLVDFRDGSGFAGDAPDFDEAAVDYMAASSEAADEGTASEDTNPEHQETEVAKALAEAAQIDAGEHPGVDELADELKKKRATRRRSLKEAAAATS